MTPRALRLWHWRKTLYYRSQEKAASIAADEWEQEHGKHSSHWRNKERNNQRNANFHLGAVQVLNDHPGCAGSTAEQDHETFPLPHSTRKRHVAAG